MSLRELLVDLAVKVRGKDELEATDQSIRRTVRSAQQFGSTLQRIGSYVIIGGVIRAVKNFIQEQITLADRLKHNSERLGISTDELQKYQYVADLMQVPVEQAAVAFRFFNRAVGEAALGTKSVVKIFAQLGVSIKDAHGHIRPTDDLLFDVADKLKGIDSQAVRTAYAMRLLGRGGSTLLPVLQNGSEELRKTFKDIDELGGGFNEDFIAKAHETDVQLKRLRIGWRSIYVAIVTELLPIFNRLIARQTRVVKFFVYLAKHTYAFHTALLALASGTLFAALYKLFKLFDGGQLTFKDVLSFFVKYPIIALFSAAVMALYVVFDDFYTFLEGGDSVIGHFIDSIGGEGSATQVVQELRQAISDVWEALKPVLPSVQDLTKGFIESIPSIAKWGGVIATDIVDVIDKAILGLRLMKISLFSMFDPLHINKSAVEAQKIIGEASKREETYSKLREAFNDITAADPATRRAKIVGSYLPGGENFSGPLQAPGGSGPPKTPVEPGGVPAKRGGHSHTPAKHGVPPQIVVNNHNNFTGATNPQEIAKTVSKATVQGVKSAVVQNRDTFSAVTTGMPVTGQ